MITQQQKSTEGFKIIYNFLDFKYSEFIFKSLFYADQLAIPFLETSAKANTNVEQAFITMASEIKNSMPAGQMGSPGSGPKVTVGPSAAINSQNQGGCC